MNITPFNNKHQRHGWWTVYDDFARIKYKGRYNNNKQIGFWRINRFNGNLKIKQYYIE